MKGNEKTFVTVIGGINIDIIGYPFSKLVYNDSNPGRVKISLGGVGRNIAHNLVKLGVNTKLISALGNDVYGKKILDEAKKMGLDMNDCLILNDYPTSSYLAILDNNGDMKLAISHMDIFKRINIDFIKQKQDLLKKTPICIIDTNISKDVIEYLLLNNKNTTFFLDTVSAIKAMKIKDLIGKFHTIKPNKIEAEKLSGIKINSKKNLEECARYFLEKGVKRVFISLGKEGVYYNDGVQSNYLPAYKINVINSTGAGDAFIAALVYSYLNNFEIDYTARFSMAASALTLSHEDTINPEISVKKIKNFIKKFRR